MKKIIILCMLFFVGCNSHPKVGDWYEHKGTRERVNVEFVGLGKLANEYCQKRLEDYKNIVPKDLQITTKYMVTYFESDSDKICLVLKTRQDMIRPSWWVMDKEMLDGDYKLVE